MNIYELTVNYRICVMAKDEADARRVASADSDPDCILSCKQIGSRSDLYDPKDDPVVWHSPFNSCLSDILDANRPEYRTMFNKPAGDA
jgi:hypothetical protein